MNECENVKFPDGKPAEIHYIDVSKLTLEEIEALLNNKKEQISKVENYKGIVLYDVEVEEMPKKEAFEMCEKIANHIKKVFPDKDQWAVLVLPVRGKESRVRILTFDGDSPNSVPCGGMDTGVYLMDVEYRNTPIYPSHIRDQIFHSVDKSDLTQFLVVPEVYKTKK